MAQVGSKYGFIDITGKLVIAPIFNQADGFGSKGLAKVLVSKLFRNPSENVSIYTNYFHYINQDGNFVHPEKPDFDIISVEQWEQENPELAAALEIKVMDGLSEYIYLNETSIRNETENTLKEKEQYEKTLEAELRSLNFFDLIKVPYFVANFVSAIILGFNCSIYSQIEYPQVWHRFIFLGIFAIFGYYSGKTFAEYQYIEGKLFNWKYREGILGGMLLLIMGLSYFYKITLYLSAIFSLLDLVLLGVFFFTTGMTLGNIFRRMASELLPSNQKGLQLVVAITLLINFIPAILFSGYNIISQHAVLGIGFFTAIPLGIIWIFLSNRKPGKEGATSLWNAFYFGSNSASFTTRRFYKKNYSERDFKKCEEQYTYTFDGDERSIAASRAGVGVICIFFTNLVITSSPWFIVDLITKLRYSF